MSVVFLVLGITILCGGIIDFIWTTLWPNGSGGFVTSRLTNGLWKTVRVLSRGRKEIMSLAGPVIIVGTLLFWILSMWTGWLLIFASDMTAFADTADNEPISWSERIYYTGYLLFTLGNGDYSPKEGIWQFLSVTAAASGLIFITIGVTYVLSVLGALTQKRALAKSISGLATSPSELVRNAWNGNDFHDVDLLLNSFSSQLNIITAQHNAYPVLHFYFSDQDQESLPLSIAILDETLTMLSFGIQKEYRPNKLLLKSARSSVESYLNIQKNAYTSPADEAPPLPDLAELREQGLPVLPTAQILESFNALENRRKSLLGAVRENERQWPGGEYSKPNNCLSQ
ncbi:potassium channel family protein [Planomicrobium sp. YIM 101495]|uniref:potassium channel family protein n=1 Tax=Planomicrobium sp. YIM 101495 TaxID=2665160 RepID=UPI0012B7EB66|nr:potassium channel family protein [Planomicrobium sp. YIM 101495]MTD29800.1 two pore domain potassium channel family protein [Planomicrobium sp. YIM 101495]